MFVMSYTTCTRGKSTISNKQKNRVYLIYLSSPQPHNNNKQLIYFNARDFNLQFQGREERRYSWSCNFKLYTCIIHYESYAYLKSPKPGVQAHSHLLPSSHQTYFYLNTRII